LRDFDISQPLLDWYDRNARDLPWRAPPKAPHPTDPYRVWLSEVMLQQTTVAAVKDYFHRFTTRWPDVHALARAPDADVMGEWAGLGYYARARNLLKCARVISADLGGVFPQTRDGLIALPGIGPYTAAAIAAIAFDRCETVVDGNVERVMARLYGVQTQLPAAKPELTALAAGLTPCVRPGDYAQAVMDLGATICTPKSPSCMICPVRSNCAALATGIANDLPRRAPKTPKPTRRGLVFIARRNDGAWLLERRPDKGLLGGMLGWPGSEWSETPPSEPPPPLPANWQDTGIEVRHTFTHFHLYLTVHTAMVGPKAQPLRGQFIAAAQFAPSSLPTVMRKAYDAAQHLTQVN